MAEQIKFGDRLFLAGEKVILDNGTNSPKLEARNGELVIGYNTSDPQAADHHVIIKGDLTVEGTTTTVNTETITLADPFILLNGDITNTTEPNEDVGIEINRGSELNKKFGWDETNDQWVTYNETLNLGTGDLIATDINAVNLTLTGQLTAASNLQHQIGDFVFNQSVMSVVSDQMEIRSPGGISFYPDSDNSLPVPQGGEKIVWLRDGAKLVFEGTIPDDYEVKLQATDITADRDILLPDESGTLALQEWTTRQIDALTTDDIEEGTTNLYYTDDRVQSKLGNVSGHILPDTDVTYDLGSPTNQFRSIYLSGQTIYMDGVELSVDGTTNNFSITNVSGDTPVVENFATETFVTQAIVDATSNGSIDLTPYALKTELFSGSYNDLSNTPNIPTNVSELGNDVGYLTSHQDLSVYALKTELFSGSYQDLSDVPTLVVSYNDLIDKPVLFDGNYNSLADKPTLFSGLYEDLLLKPTLFSGSWNDLTDKPALFTGSYTDLTNTPSLFDGQYSSLVGAPTQVSTFANDAGYITINDGYATETYVDTAVSNLVDTAPEALNTLNELAAALGDDANFSTTITGLIGEKADSSTVTNLQNILTAEIGTKATSADLATVATTGSYNDLLNKPTIPTVPNNVSSFTNDAEYLTPATLITDFGLLTDSQVSGVGSNVDATIINISSFNNDSGYARSTDLAAVATSGSYDDLTNKPTIPQNTVASSDLSTVAFSGVYNDLLLKPALFSGSYNDLTDKPALFTGSYTDLTNTPSLFDGQYSSLVGSPTNVSTFNNDAGYITDYTVTQADVTTHQASLSVTESQITDLNNYVKHSTDDHVIPDTDNTWDLGSTTNQWRTIYGHTVEATYADLAERYEADAPYDEGTVLVFGGEAEVTACTMDTDVRVAGIVSVNPGLKLNSTAGNSKTHPYIALKGRVPCKVIGPVKKGDLLVTSDTPGYARSVMGVDMGHAVLGKSLTTDLTGGEKLIEVFVV